jgi:flagellar hook-associated protein 2
MATTLGDISNLSPSALNSTYFNQLIATQVQDAQAPITQLQTDKTDLQTKRGVFVDTQTLLNSLNSLAQPLLSTVGSASIFTGMAVSSSDTTVATASGGTGALAGTYSLAVTTLATAQRVQSDTQTSSDQALQLSGSFVLGGAAARAVSAATPSADTVQGFGVAGSLRSGLTELGSGSYAVEVQNNSGFAQFRLVDATGQAVNVATVNNSSGTMTSGWQALSAVAGTTFDTGRGLTISFGSGPNTTGSIGAGAASVTYTAQGASIMVQSSDSLTTIRDRINAASYADGAGVQASIINKSLVLEAADTGAAHSITASDVAGSPLGTLGVVKSDGTFKTTLQAPADAVFTVNGMNISRPGNTGLDDVIDGVSLSLAKEGADATTTLTVQPNLTNITNQITTMLSKANDVSDYLRNQSQTTTSKDATTGAITYTRGGLAGETVLQSLRQGILSTLLGTMSGAASTSMDQLADLGITMDSSMHFSVTDSSKLQAAVAANPTGVAALMTDRMRALQTKLAPFVGATSGILQADIDGVDTQSSRIDSQITTVQKRATALQTQLLNQYSTILEMVTQYNQDYAEANSIYTESMSTTA